jgi:hypothetical protein
MWSGGRRRRGSEQGRVGDAQAVRLIQPGPELGGPPPLVHPVLRHESILQELVEVRRVGRQHDNLWCVVDRRHVLTADALRQSHAARHNVVDLPV